MKEEAKNCLGHLGILVGLTGTLMPPTEGCHPLPVHAPLPRKGTIFTDRPVVQPYGLLDMWPREQVLGLSVPVS
jgi:hypothetical protein